MIKTGQYDKKDCEFEKIDKHRMVNVLNENGIYDPDSTKSFYTLIQI